MKILVNATSVRLGGGITVMQNLIPAFLKADGGRHEYTVACRSDVGPLIAPRHPRVNLAMRPASRSTGLKRVWWEQVELPRLCAKEGYDAAFAPAGIAFLASRTPQVLMFQNMAPFDASVQARASTRGRARLRILRWLAGWSVRRVEEVVFISKFAQDSICEQLGLDAARTHQIYLGQEPRFGPMAKERGKATRDHLGLTGRYLLTVSQFYHYKNFVELVRGFSEALPSLDPEIQLVIVGAEAEHDYAAQVRDEIARLGLEQRIRLLGAVPHEELPAVYAGAELFLFPSSCESFPNILVEAMSSGVPVVTSNLGPMPELGQDGVRYFDPFKPAEIGQSIVSTLQDPSAARAMTQRAMERARTFSWAATAERLVAIFESAVR